MPDTPKPPTPPPFKVTAPLAPPPMKAKPVNTDVDIPVLALTPKDFASDQDVRWCPGCGDYSILAQVQRTMPELNVPRHQTVFVAGIGCSSRFPYYMNTYGFHGIHGRAPAIASGVKAANPDLSVWIATGDGDGLSIGGNHTLHLLRRNFNVNVLLFNNRIYGLTKGQYSPTSEHGKKTKSTPYGSIDYPLNPVLFALGCEATFVSRTIDRDPKHMQETIKRATAHKGTGFMEIYQNCNIFNDGAFLDLTEKDVKDDNLIAIKHGEPLIFGKNKDKAIVLDGFTPKVVNVADVPAEQILKHNEKDPILANILAKMGEMEGFPVPIGVFLAIERETYETEMSSQIATAKQKSTADLKKLLNSGNTWMVN
jgi:2-oxoglutarate ferredoxin oxidoreductase subunit beta